jgi:hypothetical protein
LEARKTSVWRSRYDIFDGGLAVATWDGSTRRSGGTIDLQGRRYQVRGNVLGTRFSMTDEFGGPVAAADRVGRKRWTVESGGQTYHFRRASPWSNEQVLFAADGRVGSVRRTSFWRGEVRADLPGLPLPVQVFVLGVVITMWDAQASGAAAAS